MTDYVKQYTNLVHHIANRMYRNVRDHVIDYDDVFNTGMVGLVRAEKGFDPSLGYEFTTYAFQMIRGSILTYLFSRSSLVRYPTKYVALAHTIYKRGMTDESPATIASSLDAPLEHVLRALDYLGSRQHDSLDRPIGDDEESRAWADTVIYVSDDQTGSAVDEFLRSLPESQREVVELLMDGYTASEVSRMLGVSRQAIHIRLESIRKKYKHQEECSYA